MFLLAFHWVLAVILFFLVNWIGKHSEDFGYNSTALFESPTESFAFNFLIRTFSPAVFLIAVSAVLVAIGMAELRIGIYLVAVYYYVVRAVFIITFNRQILINWVRFSIHSVAGIVCAYLAYKFLILPNISLLPDLENAGNELWLAIFAFVYAVANKVIVSDFAHKRRQNSFVRASYRNIKSNFGSLVSQKVNDDLLELIVYSILIYEDYARPSSVRFVERLMFWKVSKTTGIMQVNSEKNLSDVESVEKGLDILASTWKRTKVKKKDVREKVVKVVGEYNRDDNYISRVLEVAEILAKRADSSFEQAYHRIWGE
jgi:hypothetical protein